MTERYKAAGPDIVHEKFGDDLVVLNLGSGQYFGLNTTGAILWDAFLTGHAVSQISTDPQTSTTVQAFAAKLQELHLIEVDDAAAGAATFTPISLDEAPTIEVYDDLADLIVSDPIHDVDAEAGWPKAPADQS
ncbi:MAG: PqqD family protein [Pacificibacter sp.]|uniref:PqqD family protein n=1 Tax=Pacificibacter sp. TaxID=1917866 RepID=UPI0032193DF9